METWPELVFEEWKETRNTLHGKSTTPSNGGRIMKYGENEENFAFGFWPGTEQFPHAAFYTHMMPAPDKIAEARIQPEAAHFDATMGEFILPYEDVRSTSSPEEEVFAFFQSTYEASAALASWDRAALEGNVPNLAKAEERNIFHEPMSVGS